MGAPHRVLCTSHILLWLGNSTPIKKDSCYSHLAIVGSFYFFLKFFATKIKSLTELWIQTTNIFAAKIYLRISV